MSKRTLIMGLPGSGKTTLTQELAKILVGYSILTLNADEIRQQYDDWDFSTEGRIRQSKRMRDLADETACDIAIADFVAPLPEMRDIYDADFTIWVDTIKEGRFEDTNKAFVQPDKYDIRVTTQDCEYWAKVVTTMLYKYLYVDHTRFTKLDS
jgi:adenylylsulfate kinase